MNFDRQQSHGYLTNWAARLYAQSIEKALRPLGVNSAHMPVFFALANGRSLSQKELAQHASIEQPTMAATLNRMEVLGLIERRPDPQDRRSSLVSLTPKARELSSQVRKAGQSVNKQALAALTPDEAETYRQLLLKVIEGLQQDLNDQ
jgi:MarR family transcriptional regulator for hemolysin